MITARIKPRPRLKAVVTRPYQGKGYAEGYDQGYAVGNTEGYEKGKTDGVAEGVEQGKQAEYDRFWDTYQENGNKTNYNYAFAGFGWNDETYKPKYSFPQKGAKASGQNMYQNAKMTRIDGDFSGFNNLNYAFYQNKSIVWINVVDLTSANAGTVGTFSNLTNLVTIEKIISSENTAWNNSTFQGSSNLTNITFDGVIAISVNFQWQSLLTEASVQSIIDGLADLTGATGQKVQFHTDVLLKLTEVQVATILAKNWTF